MSNSYTVRREMRLFGPKAWTVAFNGRDIGRLPDREAALELAITEAQRTARLGRQTEVRINDGQGYVLFKSFTPQNVDDEAPPVEADEKSFDDSF